MRMAHHVEPLVGGRLAVAVQQLADAIDEDLGAAAGDAVEAGRDQPRDHLGHRQLRHPRDVQHFRRRQRVQLEVGKRCFTARNRSSYHASGRSGLWPPCSSSCTPPSAMRLFDLLEDLVEAEHVAFAVADRAVERAEVAARHADVRVVDVAIDDVGDDAVGMLAAPHGVGHPAEPVGRRVAIELERFGAGRGDRPTFICVARKPVNPSPFRKTAAAAGRHKSEASAASS